MYVNYEFYSTFYLGEVGEDLFNKLLPRAEIYINSVTMNRVKNDKNLLSEDVKMAVCAVIDTLQEQARAKAEGGIIASESVGGHSVSYAGVSNENQEIVNNRQLYNSAKLYLSYTGLIYRGVRIC